MISTVTVVFLLGCTVLQTRGPVLADVVVVVLDVAGRRDVVVAGFLVVLVVGVVVVVEFTVVGVGFAVVGGVTVVEVPGVVVAAVGVGVVELSTVASLASEAPLVDAGGDVPHADSNATSTNQRNFM